MPRPRKVKLTEVKSSSFLDALKFLSLITKEQGSPNETHIYLSSKWAFCFNGTISAATPITEDINCCPNNSLIIEALSKCKNGYSFNLNENKLSLKSDKFKAFIPCIDPTIYQLTVPDPPTLRIDDRFRLAIEAVNVFPHMESSESIVLLSILMNGQTVVGSDSKVIFEYWHGLELPLGLSIPKTFASAFIKITKKLIKFGYSQSSVTFYYEDQSWIKTQLHAKLWPDISAILNKTSNPYPLPADFFDALVAVAPFSQNGQVYFDAGTMRSHSETGVGASFEVVGLPRGPVFPAKQLALLKPWAETVDFLVPGPHQGSTMLLAYGSKMRGAIAGRS